MILMSDTGGGHRASAEAIKAGFRARYGDEFSVDSVDIWTEHTPWPFNQLPKSYGFLVKHAMLWRVRTFFEFFCFLFLLLLLVLLSFLLAGEGKKVTSPLPSLSKI